MDYIQQVPQDLHMHTVYSTGDSSVASQQTVELIASVAHARILGISDHFDFVFGERFEEYAASLRGYGLKVGTEVDGSEWVSDALLVNADYYVYHCRDSHREYRGAERLAESGKPVIIAHPFMMRTNVRKVSEMCYVEINNRYIWRSNWHRELEPLAADPNYRFVISSDAHQPNWLNQNVARYAAGEMGIEETLLFPE
jgi:histidinol phosphatase-like PHP family hydrolase